MNENVHFINKLVPVEDSSPPEELFARLAGECGKWQTSICIVAIISVYIHSIDMELTAIIAPYRVNFTCASDNSSRCFVNGTKCEHFIFKKDFNMTTLTEKFSLVCDRYHLFFWIDCSFGLGMIVGNVIVGILADKFGLKIPSMIFISSYCLTGFAVATSTTFEMFCTFRSIHAFFSSFLYQLSVVAICNNVGNKWRTFALGFALYPMFLGWITLAIIPYIFHNVFEIMAMISLTPLPLLIPLLCFRVSHLSILVFSDYEKAEECFRKMAHFNGRTLSKEIKIRPVKVIKSSAKNEIPSLSCSKFFRSKETRNTFLALLWLWFSVGVSFSLLRFSVIPNVTLNVTQFVTLCACGLMVTIFCIALCHWIQHKIVICVGLLLKNICIAATVLARHYIIQNPDLVHVGLIVMSFAALWVACAPLENLTPRMLPTGLRFKGVGVFMSVFHTGRLLLCISSYFTQRSLISVWTTTSFFLILSPVCETFCSLCLWKVHNRELPDFIEDSINFERYFKPQRYINITENKVSLHEIEIGSIKLNDHEHGKKQVLSKYHSKTSDKIAQNVSHRNK